MSKKLYVVLENTEYSRDVSFITHYKKDIEIFFNRPSRRSSFFYIEVTDKEEIKKFINDFSDRFCEIEGSVCLTPSEFDMYQNSVTDLIDGLTAVVANIVKLLKYINFTEDEFNTVNEMLRLWYMNLMKEYDDDIENDVAFNIELLMERFLRDIGA